MLYIVRHGQTDWNFLRKIQGRIDTTINENGIMQAKAMAEKLKSVKFGRAFCSPLARTKATAEIIYKGEIVLDERLMERDFGKMEGEPLMTEQFCKMWRYGSEQCPNDIESMDEILIRLKNFFADIKKYEDEDVLVVTHGGIIMVMKLLFYGVPESGDLLDYLPKNGECVTFDLNGYIV